MSANDEPATDDPPDSLLDLPADVLHRVLQMLPECDAVVVGAACLALYSAAASDELWRPRFADRFAPVVECAFDGDCLSPPADRSWREHYFEFGRSWMHLARGAGVRRVIFAISGRVYDATDYLDLHPGLPDFLLSAAGTDATEVFALAGHSRNARTILQEFWRPQLDPFFPGTVAAGAQAGAGPGSTEEEESAWRVLRLLLGDTRGRRRLTDAIGSLLRAWVVDMERSGRDHPPAPLEPQADAAEGAPSAGVTRFVPLVWRLSWAELTAAAGVLEQQPVGVARLATLRPHATSAGLALSGCEGAPTAASRW